MEDSVVVVPVSKYDEQIEAKTLLEVTKRIVRANRAGMPETLSDVSDVYLEKHVLLDQADLGYME